MFDYSHLFKTSAKVRLRKDVSDIQNTLALFYNTFDEDK